MQRSTMGMAVLWSTLAMAFQASSAQSSSSPPQPPAPGAPRTNETDAWHDFDFELGIWKTDLKILQHRQPGVAQWSEYRGTSVVHRIWNGKANIVELEADGPSGHVEALSLRLYDPASHQWSLNSASSSIGTMSVPTVGAFMNGRGEFYDFEPINGKMTLVRNVWSGITPSSCHFEQAFSEDGGKTWETNWIADDTRKPARAEAAHPW